MSKFGIEIECYNLPVCPQEIFDLGWTKKHDGSIDGTAPAEIVSPPLVFNDENLKVVKQVMKLLREAGAEINRSCGLHVHIDLQESIETCHAGNLFDTLVRRYADLEPQIDLFVPRSRRDNRNEYCYSVIGMSLGFGLLSSQRLERAASEQFLYDISRYRKINIAAYPQHGTVEFRHFGSTLNGTKVTSWIRFCHAFVEAAVRHTRLENKRVMTAAQWNNPYFRMKNQNSIRYLQTRAAEAIAAIASAEAERNNPVVEQNSPVETEAVAEFDTDGLAELLDWEERPF